MEGKEEKDGNISFLSSSLVSEFFNGHKRKEEKRENKWFWTENSLVFTISKYFVIPIIPLQTQQIFLKG